MKNILFYKKVRAILVAFLLITTIPQTLYSEKATTQPPEMSEEELKQLEQQMESEINAFVSSLPPEQQEQFYKDVEDLTEEMSKMSDEELNQFIEGVFAEPTPQETPAPTPETPPAKPIKPETQKTEEKEKPKTPETSKKKIEKIVSVLEEISEHINNFLQKSEVIIDFPQKVEKWARAGLIPQWESPDKLPWTEVQHSAVQLAQKMKSLMAKDPQTKEYYFIPKLLEDEGLINNLQLLNKKITEETNIEVPELDISEKDKLKLTLNSKKAIRTTINSILEAKTLLQIPESINTIIASFGPIAEKIKKEEQEAIKNAINALRRPQFPSRIRVVGAPEEEAPYTGPTYQRAQDYDYRMPGYDRYTAPYAKPSSQARQKNGKKGPRNGKPGKKPEKAGQNGKKDVQAPQQQPQTAAEKRANQHIETIETNLEEAYDAIEQISREKNFPDSLMQTSKSGPKEIIIDSFSQLQNSIKSATTAIRSFNTSIKSLPANTKDKLIEQVKNSIKDPLEKINQFNKKIEPSVDNMSAYPTATKIPATISSLERAINQIGKK